MYVLDVLVGAFIVGRFDLLVVLNGSFFFALTEELLVVLGRGREGGRERKKGMDKSDHFTHPHFPATFQALPPSLPPFFPNITHLITAHVKRTSIVIIPPSSPLSSPPPPSAAPARADHGVKGGGRGGREVEEEGGREGGRRGEGGMAGGAGDGVGGGGKEGCDEVGGEGGSEGGRKDGWGESVGVRGGTITRQDKVKS